MTSKNTHYENLGIEPNATLDDIKSAYRALILCHHPDRQPCSSPTQHYHERIRTGIVSLAGIDDDDAELDVPKDYKGSEVHNQTDIKNSNITEKFSSSSALGNVVEKLVVAAQTDNSPDEATFLQIQASYECLRDQTKRRQYDERLMREKKFEQGVWNMALEVDLSSMESDWCYVVNEDENHSEKDVDVKNGDKPTEQTLQKVFFHQCRCGDTVQVFQDDLLSCFVSPLSPEATDIQMNPSSRTKRIWICESCSLAIRVNLDLDLSLNEVVR